MNPFWGNGVEFFLSEARSWASIFWSSFSADIFSVANTKLMILFALNKTNLLES